MVAQPQVNIKSLYDVDYCRWIEETANALRNGNYADLDLVNLIDEIESISRSEKNALESNLVIILMHLLKWEFQPEKRSGSWNRSILEHRRRVNKSLKNSPSLVPYLESVFTECYDDARKQAAAETELPIETFPQDCPYTPDRARNPDYMP